VIPPYVDQQWLAAHPEAVLADERWYADGRSGRQAYFAGRIPGAVNVPCRQNVGADGLLLPDDELRRRFASVDRPWVSACGSGVTACQNLLVAERLDLPAGRLYAGSYSQWSATDRPVETG
jgi:thiosulfate/3-mercaptopyruvate sulfurtransferase